MKQPVSIPRRCVSCRQWLPGRMFGSPESAVCRDCETRMERSQATQRQRAESDLRAYFAGQRP